MHVVCGQLCMHVSREFAMSVLHLGVSCLQKLITLYRYMYIRVCVYMYVKQLCFVMTCRLSLRAYLGLLDCEGLQSENDILPDFTVHALPC